MKRRRPEGRWQSRMSDEDAALARKIVRHTAQPDYPAQLEVAALIRAAGSAADDHRADPDPGTPETGGSRLLTIE